MLPHRSFDPWNRRRRGVLVALYGGLVIGGLLFGRELMVLPGLELHPGDDVWLQRTIIMAVVLYVLVAALPFVPAAEIGLGLMLVLGPQMAAVVYLGTVLALTLAYLAGRAVPASTCAAAFGSFGFRKARDLMLEMAALDADARLALLVSRASLRAVPTLLRHRYLLLAAALNLPGNSLLGGGGGIAMWAGMSGLYPMPAYLATAALAVAPVPLLIGVLPGVLWMP